MLYKNKEWTYNPEEKEINQSINTEQSKQNNGPL